MSQCIECGSYAINPHRHGREAKVNLDLCDVCYWRKRATEAQKDSERLDWLNANACEFVMESNNKAIPGFSYHPNVRSAIDAAKGAGNA